MKNFILGILSLLIFGYLGSLITWWGFVLVALLAGFALRMHGGLSFLSGGLGGGLYFAIYAYLLDTANEGILYQKMAALLPFEPYLVSILIGAILGALGMLTGKYFSDVFIGENKVRKYRGRYS